MTEACAIVGARETRRPDACAERLVRDAAEFLARRLRQLALRVRDGAIAGFTYEEPFASLLGSHNGSRVDPVKFRLMLHLPTPADA